MIKPMWVLTWRSRLFLSWVILKYSFKELSLHSLGYPLFDPSSECVQHSCLVELVGQLRFTGGRLFKYIVDLYTSCNWISQLSSFDISNNIRFNNKMTQVVCEEESPILLNMHSIFIDKLVELIIRQVLIVWILLDKMLFDILDGGFF